MLNSSTVRQIWRIIENAHVGILLELSDSELVRWVQHQLETEVFIPDSELHAAQNYIQSRVPLIRDLADTRLASS